MSKTLASQVEALLARERVALLKGDFATLDSLAPLKESLFTDLVAATDAAADVAALRRIDRALGHNKSLLCAAIAGLRDGAARITVLQQAQDGFATYDRDGRAARLTRRSSGLEKKA